MDIADSVIKNYRLEGTDILVPMLIQDSRFIDTLITYKYMQHEVNKIQKRSNEAIIINVLINFFFTFFNKK